MYQLATPSYFETLRIPLRAGRFLTASDGPDAPKVAVISQSMARPLLEGRIAHRPAHPDRGAGFQASPWLTIVGVVGDVMHNPYDREPRRAIYVPYRAVRPHYGWTSACGRRAIRCC